MYRLGADLVKSRPSSRAFFNVPRKFWLTSLVPAKINILRIQTTDVYRLEPSILHKYIQKLSRLMRIGRIPRQSVLKQNYRF